ncbi:hypothetical protein [Nitrosomonas sp.]|uniref:hypothetical protein n=1 Tax=Nitrosomonas sp. TaxID=42353 RepID=UPI0032EC99A6
MKRMFLFVLLISTSAVFAQTKLPKHTIADESPVMRGTRIQLNSNDKNLTKDQCIALVKAYSSRVNYKGQVSVRKPSIMKELKGAIVPYCLDNFDGKGIVFRTEYHPELKTN